MEIFVIIIVLSIITGMIANNKGRSFFRWFLYSLLILPVAFVHSLLINKEEDENNKKCPFCAEIIKNEAVVCRFCKKDLPITPIENIDNFKNESSNTKINEEFNVKENNNELTAQKVLIICIVILLGILLFYFQNDIQVFIRNL